MPRRSSVASRLLRDTRAARSARSRGHERFIAILARDPARAKRRLAGVLRPSERARLAAAMLLDVVAAARAASAARLAVITESASLRRLLRATRVATIHASPRGMPAAARVALAAAAADGSASVLVLPADLPLARPSDIRRVLTAGEAADIVIVPDRRRRGTNALLLRPPAALAPRFGDRSFARHLAAASASGRSWRVLAPGGLALDIDGASDLRLLRRMRRRAGPRTREVLREFAPP